MCSINEDFRFLQSVNQADYFTTRCNFKMFFTLTLSSHFRHEISNVVSNSQGRWQRKILARTLDVSTVALNSSAVLYRHNSTLKIVTRICVIIPVNFTLIMNKYKAIDHKLISLKLSTILLV